MPSSSPSENDRTKASYQTRELTSSAGGTAAGTHALPGAAAAGVAASGDGGGPTTSVAAGGAVAGAVAAQPPVSRTSAAVHAVRVVARRTAPSLLSHEPALVGF